MSDILVVIALVFHLFPFRTEKLSPPAPMVLRIAGEEVAAIFFQSLLQENAWRRDFFVHLRM